MPLTRGSTSRWVAALLLAVIASSTGCSASASAPADAGRLTVSVQIGGMFTDSPSSYLVHVRRAGQRTAVAASAVPGGDTHARAKTVMTARLRPGRYVVTTGQHGCGMNGRPCPRDPDSREYDAGAWTCTATVVLPSRGRAVVRVGDAAPGSPNPRQCPALVYRPVSFTQGTKDSRVYRAFGFTLVPPRPGREALVSPAEALARCLRALQCDAGPPAVFLARATTMDDVKRLVYVLTWPPGSCAPAGPVDIDPKASTGCVTVDLSDARTGAFLTGGGWAPG